ncbi:MAG: hypothetical protein HY535_01885 [Chloroflexi bacterium]|nr:hypothetical protein [Chloroflexota bacterium]
MALTAMVTPLPTNALAQTRTIITIQVVPYRTYVKGLVIPPEDGHTHTDFATVWLDK